MVLNARAIFVRFFFLVGIEEKKWFDSTLLNIYHNSSSLTPPKSTKSFPVETITKRRKEAKRDKTKIGVGTSVTVKIRDIDEKTRDGKTRRMRRSWLDCII